MGWVPLVLGEIIKCGVGAVWAGVMWCYRGINKIGNQAEQIGVGASVPYKIVRFMSGEAIAVRVYLLHGYRNPIRQVSGSLYYIAVQQINPS